MPWGLALAHEAALVGAYHSAVLRGDEKRAAEILAAMERMGMAVERIHEQTAQRRKLSARARRARVWCHYHLGPPALTVERPWWPYLVVIVGAVALAWNWR